MLKLAGISLSVLLCSILIKEKNRAFAVMLSISGGILLFAAFMNELSTVVDRVKSLA